jgi:hypothetical protein
MSVLLFGKKVRMPALRLMAAVAALLCLAPARAVGQEEAMLYPELESETAAALAAGTNPKFGVIIDGSLAPYHAPAYPEAVAAHLGLVRLHGFWRFIELVPGGCSLANPAVSQCDWRKLDSNVNAASSQGLQIYIGMGFWPPQWANGTEGMTCEIHQHDCAGNPPTNVAYWTNFVTALVNRYKDRVQHFALWNEPDYPTFWNANMDRFVNEILKPGADAVRAASPTAKVIGGEISDSETKLGNLLWGGCSKLDIVAVHLFRYDVDKNVNHFLNHYVPAINQYCGSSKPVWVTAFGLAVNRITVPPGADPLVVQAQMLEDHLVRLDAIPRVGRIIYFNMVDNPNSAGLTGLLGPAPGYERKPSFYAMQEYLASLQVYALTVARAGAGAGTVTSSPAGISCGADCSESYAGGTVVTLSASPAAGSWFGGWSGDADCGDGLVTMTAARNCTATFNVAANTLTVSKAGTGSGTVTSNPAGISCGADCTETYGSGTVVNLTATPAAGSVFAGWSGHSDCLDGSVTMAAARSCTATFNATGGHALTVTRAGTGSGTVTSSPPGISCGADCAETYSSGTVVSLTPTAAAGSTFAGWSGDADCGDGVLSMTAGRACTATFNLANADQTVVWVEDDFPTGAATWGDGGDGWNWVTSNPTPFSGSRSHQSNLAAGLHQHYFHGAPATLSVSSGDVLVAYVYLDPANLPSEVMLQWNDGNWEHRAYWGANLLGWGTDGTVSRRYMGALPAAGQWVRLEVPASLVGLEGRFLNGMAFTLWGGRATWDRAGLVRASSADTIWVGDDYPAGAATWGDGGDSWTWVTSNPTPFSGSRSHQSNLAAGLHQHFFHGAPATLSVSPGDVLVAYVYLDPANPPSEVMLQWNDGTWNHRAYWGANLLGWGTDGTVSRRYMGALPAAGQWVRLEVPASLVGLEGRTLNGMAFSLWGGRATWDHAGKRQ